MRKSLRRDVLTRDSYACQHPLCQGVDDELTIHHIIPVTWFVYHLPGENPHVASNVITLCSQCHQGKLASIYEVYSSVIHSDQAMYYHLFGRISLPERIWDEIRNRRRKKTEQGKEWWRTDFDDKFREIIRENSENMEDYEYQYSVLSQKTIQIPVFSAGLLNQATHH